MKNNGSLFLSKSKIKITNREIDMAKIRIYLKNLLAIRGLDAPKYLPTRADAATCSPNGI